MLKKTNMTISKGKQRKEKQKPIKQYTKYLRLTSTNTINNQGWATEWWVVRGTVDKVINVIYTDDYYILYWFYN
jgi:hypothetical protein